jgi:hypothetical protein
MAVQSCMSNLMTWADQDTVHGGLIMKRLIPVILLVMVLMAVFAVPAAASVPANGSGTATVTGYGLFGNQPAGIIGVNSNGNTQSKQLISFNVFAKVPLYAPPPVVSVNGPVSAVSGRLWLFDALGKKAINGCIQGNGAQNAVIGDLILTGTCTINGKGSFYFELGLCDYGRGLGAIGQDQIYFFIPDCNYYVSGTLCAGDICIPPSLIPPD